MKRLLISLLLVSGYASAQVTIQSTEANSKQVVVRYLVPPGYSSACTVRASYVNDFSGAYVPVIDVDGTQFPGSDQDTSRATTTTSGRSRTVTIGEQIPYWQTLPASATTNWKESHGLKAATPVYVKVTCGGSSATTSVTTTTVPFGLTFAEATPADPSAPGFANWPSIKWGTTQTVIDPEYGTEVKRPEAAGTRGVTQKGPNAPQEAIGSSWTNRNNILANDSSSATISASQSPLVIPWPYAVIPLGSITQKTGDTAGLDWIQLILSASGSASTTTDRTIQVCLAIDAQGGTCYTPWHDVVLGTTEASVSYPASPTPVDYWQTPGDRPIPRQWLTQRFGTFQYVDSTKTVTITGGNHNSEKLATGARFRVLSATAPAIKNIVGGTPLTVETQTAHGFTTGDAVVISGANGTLGDAAAGTWTVTVTSSTQFTLNGSSGSGSYGRVIPLGTGSAGATPGSPPRVYAPNAFLPDSVTVLMNGFVVGDGDWQTLNGNIYVAHQYFGTTAAGGYSENFTLTGATTTSSYTGTYPTGASLTLLTGRCQKVTNYTVATVVDATHLTLQSPGIGSDVGPIYSGTDLQVSTATDADHVVYSATHPFQQSDVGNYINVTVAGSTGNWGIGIYKILGVSVDGWATLDNAPAGGGSVGATWAIEQSWLVDPVSIMIRKKTTSADTISLQFAQVKIQSSAGNAWAAAGGEICAPYEAVGAGGVLGGICTVGSASMWIPRDGTAAIQYGKIGYESAGDIGNLGVAIVGDGDNDRGSIAVNPNDPKRFYAGKYVRTGPQPGIGFDQVIIVGEYEGDFTQRSSTETATDIQTAYPGYGSALGFPWLPNCYGDGKFNDGINPKLITGANPRCVSYKKVVPSIQAVMAAQDTTHWPRFVSAVNRTPCIGGAGARMNFIWRPSTSSVWATISCNAFNDEGGVWYAFDLGNEIPYGTGGSTVAMVAQADTWSTPGGRWSKFHGGMGLQDGYTVQAPHPQTVQSGIYNGVVYNQTCGQCGPFFVDFTSVNGVSNAPITSTLQSCAAWAGSPYLPTPTPDGTGGTGCTTVVVSGEPCDESPTPEEAIILAANTSFHLGKCGASSRYWVADAIVGDIVLIDHDADRRFDQLEPAIVIAKTGTTWVLARGFVYRVGLGNPGFAGVVDHTGDTKRLIMQFSYDTTNGGYPTYFRAYDPAGTVLVQKLGLGHGAVGRTLTAGSSGGATYGVIRGTIQQRVAATAFDFTIPSRGLPFAGAVSGNNVCQDSHLSFIEAAALVNKDPWILDAAPWNGYSGTAPTRVGSTTVYKWNVASLNANSCAAQFPKFLPPEVRIGSWVTRNISGPGSVIDDTKPYTFCVAYAANECQSGSVAGDAFVAAPLIDQTSGQYQCCGNDYTTIRDFNIGVANQTFSRFLQIVLRNDATGKTGRAITSMFHTPRAEDSFMNWSGTNTGDLGVLRQRGTEFVKSEIFTTTMAPLIEDGIDRTKFWQHKLTIKARAGADNVLVRFGYQHYGDVSTAKYYCTNRLENCLMAAGTSSSVPFYYETTDSYSGVTCSSGCTVNLPLIPNRVAYYEVVYRNSTTPVYTTPRQPVVSP